MRENPQLPTSLHPNTQCRATSLMLRICCTYAQCLNTRESTIQWLLHCQYSCLLQTCFVLSCCAVQAQIEALMTEYGVQQSTADLALPLWTAVLAQSGVLNDEQHE